METRARELRENDMENLVNTDMEASFVMKNMTAELAATFRKILMADVPSMAIYPVIVHKNTTVYETYTIVHKLRFIPLAINPDDYVFPEECDCTEFLRKDSSYDGEIINGCDKCSIEISLSVIGKWNDKSIREITSRDLWCPKYEDVFDKVPEIPLFRIKKGEEVQLSCRAFKGYGERHAMWSPVTVVHFKKIESEKDEEDIQYRENLSFNFYFEAVGSLKPSFIIEKALDLYSTQKRALSISKDSIRHRYLPCEYSWVDDPLLQ